MTGMTLVEFLRARLDDDEAVARDASSGEWRREGINSVVDADGRLVIYGDGPAPTTDQAEHIARHDPARVLAEVETKRLIVEEYRQAEELALRDHNEAGLNAWAGALERVVLLLALPYAHHPDYNSEWRP